MKKILLIVVAICFVFAGGYETFAQKRKVAKKSTKRKLVKCRVKGKIVYRTSCRAARVENPELAIRAATQGNRTTQTPDEPYGLVSGMSEGTGTGGGVGNGTGIGMGRGSGNGAGYGNGSGIGNGDGNIQPETTVTPGTRVNPIGPTQGVKILSKPRANYTDAARANQVQGKVVLRVTFRANGSIGAISVISGLSNGLTEQAIAAARGIRFEPAKRNGVPYTISRPVEYNFTIY